VDGDQLLHQVQVEDLVSVLLTTFDDVNLPLLRLCGFDDLEQAAIALAPVATGKRGLAVNVDSITELQNVAVLIRITGMYLLGHVLTELDHRCQRDYTEEKYQREWDETHAAWMARLDAQLVESTGKKRKGRR
jgi:hypothetical protein